jgi:hypothetical protein
MTLTGVALSHPAVRLSYLDYWQGVYSVNDWRLSVDNSQVFIATVIVLVTFITYLCQYRMIVRGVQLMVRIAILIGGILLGGIAGFIIGSMLQEAHTRGMSVPELWTIYYFMDGLFAGFIGALIGTAVAFAVGLWQSRQRKH